MTGRAVRILYFVPEFQASVNPVFQSQVLGQAHALARAGYECMIVGTDRGGQGVEQAKGLPGMNELAGVRIYDLYPANPSWRTRRPLISSAARQAYGDVASWRPDFIYTRNYATFPYAERMAAEFGAVTVSDVRGLEADEVIYKHARRSWPFRLLIRLAAYWRVTRHEAARLRRADRLLCVSRRFRSWIARHAGRSDAFVVPSCVAPEQFRPDPEARNSVRRQLGWSEQTPVVVFCGGFARWHRLDAVLSLLSGAQRALPELRVLFLMRAAKNIAELARGAGLGQETFAVKSLPHQEVPNWLTCADAGVILRDNVLFNNVASPIKIPEYLASGLPVICSDGIGDFSELIAEQDVGLVLASPDESASAAVADFVRAAASDGRLRQRARQVAEEYLSWPAHLETYRKVYALDERDRTR